MFERDRDINVGLFAIKPSVYEFEHEVRAILYPKRELLAPLEVPHQNVAGFSLSLNPEVGDTQSVIDFIESVYVHPMLEEDSLIVHAVTEINRRFGQPRYQWSQTKLRLSDVISIYRSPS